MGRRTRASRNLKTKKTVRHQGPLFAASSPSDLLYSPESNLPIFLCHVEHYTATGCGLGCSGPSSSPLLVAKYLSKPIPANLIHNYVAECKRLVTSL